MIKIQLAGFLIATLFGPLSVDHALARECTADVLKAAEATLPPAILVPDGSDPLTVLSRAYGCNMADYDPWKGATIYDADGTHVGNIFALAVDHQSGNPFVLFQPPTDNRQFAINADSLKDYTASVGAEFAAVKTDAKKDDYFSVNEDELSKEDTPYKIHVETMASFSSAPSPSDLTVLNFNLPPGLKPFGDREPIAISSKPVGAEVDFAGQAAGQTSNIFLVRQSDLQSVALVESGYVACHFTDGTYKLASQNGAVGNFFCALRRK